MGPQGGHLEHWSNGQLCPRFAGIVASFINIPQIWDLFEGNNMFKVRDSKNELSMEHQLAHIVALLGPPPADFVKGNDIALKYFNADGECLKL
jgi:hypothetical protein